MPGPQGTQVGQAQPQAEQPRLSIAERRRQNQEAANAKLGSASAKLAEAEVKRQEAEAARQREAEHDRIIAQTQKELEQLRKNQPAEQKKTAEVLQRTGTYTQNINQQRSNPVAAGGRSY